MLFSSVWHILMAGSLLFLVPRCRKSGKSWQPDEIIDKDIVGIGELNDGASLSENSSQATSRGIPSTESSDTVSSIHSLQVESPMGPNPAENDPEQPGQQEHDVDHSNV